MGKKLQAPKKVEKLTIQRLNGMEMQKFYLQNGVKPIVPGFSLRIQLVGGDFCAKNLKIVVFEPKTISTGGKVMFSDYLDLILSKL